MNAALRRYANRSIMHQIRLLDVKCLQFLKDCATPKKYHNRRIESTKKGGGGLLPLQRGVAAGERGGVKGPAFLMERMSPNKKGGRDRMEQLTHTGGGEMAVARNRRGKRARNGVMSLKITA